MRRKIALWCFLGAFIIYIGCALCAGWNFLIDWDIYFKIATIVGGLASIIGILGLSSNPLKDSDIRDFRSDSLKKLAQTAEEIEAKHDEIEETNKKISSLEYKKEELEVLVEKASLSLYYKGELERSYSKLSTLIASSKEINDLILSIQQLEHDAGTLNNEIENNKDIQDVISTIEKAKQKAAKRNFWQDLIISFGSLGFPIK